MFQATIPQHYYHAGWNGRDLQLNLKDLRVVRSLSLKSFPLCDRLGVFGPRNDSQLEFRQGPKCPTQA